MAGTAKSWSGCGRIGNCSYSVYTECISNVYLNSSIPMELLVKINKKLEQRRAILNTIIQNVGIQNKILKSAQILAECLKLGGKIITAGNGGSASQSEHFSSEMMGRLKNSRTPFPSLSLSSNASLLTCIGNDFGFERIFSRQIEGIGTTKDVFLAFTTSCKSRNIIEALNVCKNSNINTLLILM